MIENNFLRPDAEDYFSSSDAKREKRKKVTRLLQSTRARTRMSIF